jgi:hypothetical protein
MKHFQLVCEGDSEDFEDLLLNAISDGVNESKKNPNIELEVYLHRKKKLFIFSSNQKLSYFNLYLDKNEYSQQDFNSMNFTANDVRFSY